MLIKTSNHECEKNVNWTLYLGVLGEKTIKTVIFCFFLSDNHHIACRPKPYALLLYTLKTALEGQRKEPVARRTYDVKESDFEGVSGKNIQKWVIFVIC